MIRRQLPPMGTLAVFESAGRLLSFSRAAEECALSQASVSRQIRQLEENLSVQLFDRHRHDVTLTEAGARFHETVVRSLTSLSSIASELRSHSQRDTRFTIYSDLSLATHVLTPVIEHLQERFPEIAFIIHSSYEPVEQTDISFDLGLQPGARATTGFEQKTIGEDLMFPVCSPAFLDNCKQNLSVTELCQLPLLQVDYENKGGVDWDNFLSQFDMTLSAKKSDLIFSSYQVCLSVAEQGHGVALGWARSVNHKLAEGKLVRISNLSAVVPDGVVVYRKKYGEAHPITNDVMKIIENSLSPLTNC